MDKHTCGNCGREIDLEEDAIIVGDDALCIDCADLEEPTFEPEDLDFNDHSHELQQDEEELE